MNLNFVSTTQLQKNPSKVLNEEGIQIVLKNNQMQGVIFSAKIAKRFLDLATLRQIQEELYEMSDPETVKVIEEGRSGKKKGVDFFDFMKQYGVQGRKR
ncbi:MAG: hypothetical protein G01um101418_202 [Parcubacteria group bacterium Gr01-1014_18]|nr:MAG: hypothetical protein Greene041636_170 [Parcubacteria group bacterium Greene0416_36]TSC81362.1 MAG: hypothetical protein G01um101418_202 [Parcubacteria group bacterium Gr01-1014_18]TSC99452.1 MAG: hypothetical protein Greene101420_119 [Parcubacteria group bacterium Greene1014_20]TSD07629.1 MAG: hypothetical protein Greene07142_86 [Parcubacteria group bacterium Greene0714_2]